MQLTSFRVCNYRSILDSGWVDVSDITVVVGKNESGKTSLLKALHKFNPFKAEAYSIDREWPRGHRKERSTDAIVVEIKFSFTDEEKKLLAAAGEVAGGVEGVQISKTYKGDQHFAFWPNDLPNQHDSRAVEESVTKAVSESNDASPQLIAAMQNVQQQVSDALQRGGVQDFSTLVAAFQQVVDQGVKADQPSDQPAVQKFKQVLTSLQQKAAAPPPKTAAVEIVKKLIPVFIYMDDHRPFSGVAHLNQIKQRKDQNQLTDEDKTVLTIFTMASINFDEEHARASAADKEQRMLDMNDASLTLTSLIAHHWSQRKYVVRFEADGEHVIAFVSDDVQPSLVPLNERSKGFQWFFSFDMTFMHETRGTFKDSIILLDEPGLHLHAAAQRDLLLRMKEYAKGNQLVYTTHMPFMIDMQRLDNIRVCVENKEAGAKVTADFYAADEDARFPLQAALGLSISQSLFVGQFNLVVEGIVDFWFLSAVSAILRDGGKPSLDERVVITPSGGATKAAYVGTMLQAQKLSVVVLLDSDSEGRKVAEGLIKQWIMKDRHVLLLGNALGRREDTAIEDLFSLDFYLGYVNSAYVKELGGKPITANEVSGQHAVLVADRIDAVLVARGLPKNSDGVAFNKGRPAKLMLREWAGKSLSDFPANTFQGFERLFETVNKAMPSLAGSDGK